LSKFFYFFSLPTKKMADGFTEWQTMCRERVKKIPERICSRDTTLEHIGANAADLSDEELAPVFDALLEYDSNVKTMHINGNKLTDVSGVKVARYLSESSTIVDFGMGLNECSQITYFAIAMALNTNSSLERLWVQQTINVDERLIDAAFIHALRLNPNRSPTSEWYLCSHTNDYNRLKKTAEHMGHPTLQELLCGLYITDRRTVRRNFH
jgi:hypothetical protein